MTEKPADSLNHTVAPSSTQPLNSNRPQPHPDRASFFPSKLWDQARALCISSSDPSFFMQFTCNAAPGCSSRQPLCSHGRDLFWPLHFRKHRLLRRQLHVVLSRGALENEAAGVGTKDATTCADTRQERTSRKPPRAMSQRSHIAGFRVASCSLNLSAPLTFPGVPRPP